LERCAEPSKNYRNETAHGPVVLLQPRTVQQVAALPFVALEPAIEVLLVTSRRRGRWIVPKGWPEKGVPLPECAAQEAEEEAGVVGPVAPVPVGTYRYDKRMPAGYKVPCQVFVYPILVRQHLLTWPEQAERRLQWVGLAAAASLVDDRNLAVLLRALAANDGAVLRVFARKTDEAA